MNNLKTIAGRGTTVPFPALYSCFRRVEVEEGVRLTVALEAGERVELHAVNGTENALFDVGVVAFERAD